MSKESPEANRPTFTESVDALATEREQVNPALEKQLSDLARRTRQEDLISLDEFKINDVKERLARHSSGEMSAQKLSAQDALHQKVARYLAETGSGIAEGKEQLASLSNFFGEAQKEELTSEDTEEVERYLLGDAVYASRYQRFKNKYGEDIPPQARTEMLQSFLKATSREGYRAINPDENWKDRVGPAQHLQERVLEGLSNATHLPVRVLAEFIAKEGSDDFLLRSPFGTSELPLADHLQLERMKQKIVDLPADIESNERAEIELKLIDWLSKKIYSMIPYESGTGSISAMQERQKANCIGYATMGVLAMKELGIESTMITGTHHAFAGFTLGNGTFYLNDFQGQGSRPLEKDALDRISPEELVTFMDDKDKKSLAVQTSIGTNTTWWNKSGGQETLYMYKDIEPALIEWAAHRHATSKKEVPASHILGSENVIDSHLSTGTREDLVTLIKQNPDDVKNYEALSDLESMTGMYGSGTSDKIRELRSHVGRSADLYKPQQTKPPKEKLSIFQKMFRRK